MAKAPLEIRSLARTHTEAALRTLVSIMNNERAHSSVRISAAQYLLDRGWGKAPQSLEIIGEITNKVIRAPAMAVTAQAWSETHSPHTEH